MTLLKKKNYKGKLCLTCAIPITIGSKSGFCRKHCDSSKKKWSFEKRNKLSITFTGKGNPMFGKEVTKETRLKLSEALQGKKSPYWKGGITPEHRRLRKGVEYKLWREAVFRRDNYTCVDCNKRGGVLNADHIKPFSLFPELRFAIDNGRTLCKSCHLKTDTYAGRIKTYA